MLSLKNGKENIDFEKAFRNAIFTYYCFKNILVTIYTHIKYFNINTFLFLIYNNSKNCN